MFQFKRDREKIERLKAQKRELKDRAERAEAVLSAVEARLAIASAEIERLRANALPEPQNEFERALVERMRAAASGRGYRDRIINRHRVERLAAREDAPDGGHFADSN